MFLPGDTGNNETSLLPNGGSEGYGGNEGDDYFAIERYRQIPAM